MSSLGWTVVISGFLLVHMLAPPVALRCQLFVSVAIATLGIAYMVVG
jgi:hypothetical protein